MYLYFQEEFNVERDIDQAREWLGNQGTPMTFELYGEWKARRKARKLKELEERKQEDLKKAGIKPPKGKKIMTGKALFVFDPTLFQDDEGAADKKDMNEDEEEGLVEADAEELNKGGKQWEAKVKKEVIEEENEGDDDEPEEKDDKVGNNQKDGAKVDGEQPDANVEVDEDLFADEEELPEDLE